MVSGQELIKKELSLSKLEFNVCSLNELINEIRVQ